MGEKKDFNQKADLLILFSFTVKHPPNTQICLQGCIQTLRLKYFSNAVVLIRGPYRCLFSLSRHVLKHILTWGTLL